ncbi:MAG TPA: right-handed parallel beta-helix repeat-containing protein [Candidatus Baltobacteraceae bacterium]|nr:right-handed parallel beta-helix repeat-containing protein [Candidatus Baltobacteraceae bacterium]
MKLPYGLLFFAAVGIAVCATTGQASAQATRTWVSGVGDDANPCSRTAPCKTWAGAISKTTAGGEIDALDPGGFGGLTITKAITIDGGGGQVASTLVSGTPGFSVSAGATDIVVVRNMRFQGLASGTSGIIFNSGAGLVVENCWIQGFTSYGIQFQPSTPGSLFIRDSTLELNSLGGINASTTSTTSYNHVTAINTSFRASNNGPGITVGQNTYFDMKGGEVAGNVKYGALASGVNAFLALENVAVTNNFTGGLHATSSGIIAAANSAITFNVGTGVVNDNGGQTATFGNNQLQYNRTGSTETDGTFSQTLTQH